MHFSMQEHMHWFLKWSASAVKASLAAQVVCWPTFVFLRPHHKPWIASFRCVWWKTRVLPSALIGIRPSVRQSPGASDISKPGTIWHHNRPIFIWWFHKKGFSIISVLSEKWNNMIPVDCLVSFGDGWFNHQKPWISARIRADHFPSSSQAQASATMTTTCIPYEVLYNQEMYTIE